MRGKRDTPAVAAIKGQGIAQLPQDLQGVPVCPSHLDTAAKKEFKRIAGLLDSVGLLSLLDGGVLALYCTAYSRWIEAEKGVAKHGIVTISPTGAVSKSTYLLISQQCATQMHQYAGELGMTPNARSRIKPEKKETVSTLDAFLVA